jgi:hypothetical protein
MLKLGSTCAHGGALRHLPHSSLASTILACPALLQPLPRSLLLLVLLLLLLLGAL